MKELKGEKYTVKAGRDPQRSLSLTHPHPTFQRKGKKKKNRREKAFRKEEG